MAAIARAGLLILETRLLGIFCRQISKITK